MSSENTTPSCSIIIPLFNKEQRVESCLASAQAQTVEALEIIVVDDGSTDGSAALVEAIAATDARVTLIRQVNAGPSAARNTGLDAARGKYVTFLDADDRLAPGFVGELSQLMTREHAEAARCAQLFVEGALDEAPASQHLRAVTEAERALPGSTLYRRLFAQVEVALMSVHSALYKRDLLVRRKLRFNEELRHLEDILFVAQLYAADTRIALSNQALYIFQHQADNSLADERSGLAEAFPPFVAALEKLEGGNALAASERPARLHYCAVVLLTILASPPPEEQTNTFYRDFLRSELVRRLLATMKPERIPSSLSIALALAGRENPRALGAYCAILAQARRTRKAIKRP